MNDEEPISKQLFLADFFCSELAAEVYRNTGTVKEVTEFAEVLWETIQASKEESEGDEDNDYYGT